MSADLPMVTAAAEIPAPRDDAPPSPLAVLFAPDRAMDRQARVGRARWYLLFAVVCSLLLAAALVLRVDARSSTLRRLDGSGQLKGMSDRQIADETHKAERVFTVTTIAKGALGPPLSLGSACLAVLFLSWFFRGRIKGSAVAPVAAATLLPGSLAHLLDAGVAFMHAAMPPEGIPLAPRTLTALLPLVGHPLMGPWAKVGNALDVFSLWAAVIMGYGLAAGGQVPKRTALIGTIVAWVCWRLVTQVAANG